MGSGSNYHEYESVKIEYRSLNKNEYYGMKYLISSKCDTIDNTIYYEEENIQIKNKISKDEYYIIGKGNYTNNRKEGLWQYFHHNEELKKEIYYKNGVPDSSYKIFNTDKSLLFEVIKINQFDWEITKYGDTGSKLYSKIYKIDKFKELY